MTQLSLVELPSGECYWTFKCFIFPTEIHDMIYNLYVVSFWREGRQRSIAYQAVSPTDDKSTLIQVMAWCRQATRHYLSQCWPRSMSPYGVTRPKWVNSLAPGSCGSEFTIFKLISRIDIMNISCEIAFKWMPQDLSDNKSTFVQVRSWCH